MFSKLFYVRALLIALLLFTSSAYAAPHAALVTKTWDGSNSPDWHDPVNWTPIGLPGVSDDVVIPSGPANQPQITSGPVAIQSLTVNAGAALQIWGQPVDLSGNLLVNGAVSTFLGGAPLNVAGNFTVSGSAASMVNDGATNLTGNGTLTVSSSATVSPLRITGGLRNLATSVVPELHLVGGEAHVNNAVTFTVSSLLRLEGGTLSFDTAVGNTDTLHVDGDVEVIGTVAGSNTSVSRLVVGGNWTGTAAFVMNAGWVEMDTGGSSTIGGSAPTFGNLQVTSDLVTLNASTQVQGTLQVTSTGRLDVNAAALTVGGDFINTSAIGGVTGTQPIVLAGNGGLQANASTHTALIQASGAREVSTSTLTELTVNGGSLLIKNATTLKVLGDLNLNGGTLNFDTTLGNADTLEVDGNVVQNGTVMGTTTAVSTFHADGSWFANAPFVMADGWVNFRGAAPQIGGTQPAFKRMRIQGGSIELLSDVAITGTVNASTGGTFGAGYLEFMGTTETISGNANVLERVRIASGANVTSTLKVDELEMTGGSLLIGNGAVVTVNQEARLLGGTLNFDTTSGFADVLDVNGDLIVNGAQVGTTTAASFLRVQGDWIGHTAFVLPNGWVELDGDGALIGGAARAFHRLRLASGDRVLPQDIQITGVITRQSGTVSGPGFIEFLGSSGETVSLGGFTVPNVRVVAGDIPFTTIEVQTLEVTGGSLNVGNGVTFRVLGDAALTGGVINWDTLSGFADILAVEGDLLIDGAQVGTTTTVTVLRVHGELTLNSPFVLPDGWVEMRGVNSSITGTDRGFNRLNFFSGDCVLPADIYISRAVKRQSGTCSGPGYVEIVDDLTEAINLAGFVVPFLRISNGIAPTTTIAVNELEITGGTLAIQNAVTCTVEVEARLSGGAVSFDDTSGFIDVLDIKGDLIETGTVVSQATTVSRLRLRGDYESDTGFNVEPGITEFLGTNQVLRGANPVVANMSVNGPTLSIESATEVRGNLTLVNGTTTGPEWLEVVGDGLITTSANVVEKLRVVSGVNKVTTSRIDELELLGGSLEITNGAVVTIDDVVRLVAGELKFDTTSGFIDVLDVNGNFEQVGTVCSASTTVSRIRCAGNWSSNSSFGMALGIVELDGAGTTTVSGSLPGFDPTFPNLQIKNGVRTLANGPAVTAGTTVVDTGATLSAGAAGATLAGGPMTVNGTLDVVPGGALQVDGTAPITINASGSLELIGAPGLPAVLTGTNHDLDVVVNGTFAARDFEVRQPVATGFLLQTGASIAAAPDDMRGGVFAEPDAAPGSVLLDVRPAAAKTFFFVRFDDPLNVGTFNVSRTSGAPIAFQNFGGNFGGDVFEHDPNTLIDWLPTTITQLVDFTAKPGPEQVSIAFETSVEVDVAWFHLQASTSAAGPFTTIMTFAPLGVGSYAFVESGLAPDQTRFYRLVEEQTSGFQLILDEVSATPYSAANPANVRTVGSGGEFATIQAAVDAAVHGETIVRVAPGVYPSFTIASPAVGSVHVIADGAVTIDASAAPVVVSGLAVGQTVELAGLDIVGGVAGIDAFSNAGLILLDRVTVSASGPAATFAQSAFVNLTRSDFLGAPGLEIGAGTKAWGGRSTADSLSVLAGASWQTCGFAATSSSIDPGATVLAFPGVMPALSIDPFQSLCQTFSITVEAAPNSFFQLGAAGIAKPLDLGATGVFQMLPVLNPATYSVVAQGFVPAMGSTVLNFELPPNPAFLGNRFLAQAWSVTATPGLEVRFSNPVTVIGMP